MLVGALASFAPFRIELPSRVPNGAHRLADGSLLFAGDGRAETSAPPDWLAVAVRTSALRLSVRARATAPEQRGPARLVSVAADRDNADLVLGQDGSDLVARVRRAASDASGEPALTAAGVFDDLEFHDIDLVIGRGSLELRVDGRRVAGAALDEGGLRSWDRSYELTLGDEADGARPWRGELAQVEVAVPGAVVDALRSPTLELPSGRWRYRVPTLGPALGGPALVDLAIHGLLFAPIGWLLMSSLADDALWTRAWAGAVGYGVFVEAGQLAFAGRHASVTDLGMNLVSMWVGCWACAARARRPLVLSRRTS